MLDCSTAKLYLFITFARNSRRRIFTDRCAGIDIQDHAFLEALRTPQIPDLLPPEYSAWLTRNVDYYDPIFRTLRIRGSSSLNHSGRNPSSYKCSDERCIHYVYGFPNQDDRDRHAKDHVPSRRDSQFSIGNTPTTAFPDSASTRGNFGFEYTPKHASSSPLYLPKPTTTFPSLTGANQPKDRRDALLAYSAASYPGPSASSADPEVDPQLPPIKKARVGPSRLESIDELKLSSDAMPCLRCKAMGRAVRLSSRAVVRYSPSKLTCIIV